MTAEDTFYATSFPSCAEMERFLLHDLPKIRPALRDHAFNWKSEMGPNNHQLLKEMFESRLDSSVVRRVGEEINKRGDKTAMQANFYIYCHFVGERLKHLKITGGQWEERHFVHAKMISKHWSGIGTWLF